jgi:hypothetical protein
MKLPRVSRIFRFMFALSSHDRLWRGRAVSTGLGVLIHAKLLMRHVFAVGMLDPFGR